MTLSPRPPMDLLFMPDLRADPVWDAAPHGGMISLDTLPISEDTCFAIRVWASRWEELAWDRMEREDARPREPLEPEPDRVGAWETVARDGARLCQLLRDELGDPWRVGWVSQENAERYVQWEMDGPVLRYLPSTDA